MRNRLIEKLTKSKKGSFGYTMTELLVVIAIIAIMVAIAIPSVIAISRALKFKRLNDHAKSIFMAAQQNLTDMRSDGELYRLQKEGIGNAEIPAAAVTEDLEDYVEEYVYTSRGKTAFNLILPAGSVEATVLEGQIVVEYSPVTGNVFAVYYSEEKDQNIAAEYKDAGLPRDKDARKERMLGYYDGSGILNQELEWQESDGTILEYEDGEEGIVKVKVKVPADFYGSLDKFAQALTIDLTVTGEYNMATDARTFTMPIKDTSSGLSASCYVENIISGGSSYQVVVVEYPIDSLVNYGSFANYSAGIGKGSAAQASIATLTDESKLTVYPGDNVTIQADITVDMDITGVPVKVEPGVLSGINPMFDYLMPSDSGKGYWLGVANGRHLQNLNAIAPTIADKVEVVSFADDIDWNETVTYYNNKYEGGNTYFNTHNDEFTEAPARALPYFVPIHNGALFGSATFIYPGGEDATVGNWLQQLLENLWTELKKIGEVLFGGFITDNVPTLTDELDSVRKHNEEDFSHASIQGAGHKVYNLNIDSNLYKEPASGKFYTDYQYQQGTNKYTQKVDYYFTGLFGYVNTPIDGLYVVNPVVKGHTIVGKGNPATGALVGAAGYNTVITNSGVYVDKNGPGYMPLYLTQAPFSASGTQNWYGVSGEGAVGGLVGYAKSHRNVSSNLAEDEAVLAFSRCFAAVPVSGNMRTDTAKDYGYSNGVGAFIGNSQLTNFFQCYASGNVIANNCMVTENENQATGQSLINQNSAKEWLGASVELLYSGRKSWGAGGFVGTSHGTRYTNCFATGDVTGYAAAAEGKVIGDAVRGAGGFVGFMSLDETTAYGNAASVSQVAQRTIFTECYAAGLATTKIRAADGTETAYRYDENFSGANGRIVLDIYESMANFIGDYYRLYAPYRYLTAISIFEEEREPQYGDSAYVYRDTYYLNYARIQQGEQNASRTCADPTSYEDLQDMINLHSTSKDGREWADLQINRIKSIPVMKFTDYGGLFVLYDLIPLNPNTMSGFYRNELAEGFSADQWDKSTTTDTTHPYSVSAGGALYPFVKIKGLDYYGDWPSKPSQMGMAYFEMYEGGKDQNGVEKADPIHYLYDRERDDEDTRLALKDGDDVVVLKDGYAIFSASSNTLYVTINGTEYTLDKVADSFFIEGQNFNAFLFTDEMMEELPAKGEFYLKVSATHKDGSVYEMYFNPGVAMTHVNPSDGSYSATKPATAPSIMYVRSARQFKALSSLQDFWGNQYRYIQQLNIDASVYGVQDANKGWEAWEDADRVLKSIGTAAKPFEASYTAGYSAAGTTKQYVLDGFTLDKTASGIFGAIGAKGSVENLSVTMEAITTGDAATVDAAVLAGQNAGSINNVDLTLSAVSLTASDNAGLLVGYNTGAVRNCDVTAAAVTLKAENCGGLIGSTVGTETKNVEIANNKLTMNSLTADISGTQYVGGLIGYGKYLTLNATEPLLTVADVTADAEYAGVMAGYLEEANISVTDVNNQVTVRATGTMSNPTGYAAGFLGGGKNVIVSGASVNVKAVSGKNAAGFLGHGNKVSASLCNVIVNQAVTGVEQAAGVACTISGQSKFNTVPVSLTNVTVSASNGDAAGYAVEITREAEITDCVVTLGGKAKINASNNAAGFACRAAGYVGHNNGSNVYTSVVGKGQIIGAKAAGFACEITYQVGRVHVSPAVNENNYLHNSNDNLLVKGSEAAAGFALHVGKNGIVSNSYALNRVESPASSGFVGTNEGTINSCMANITIPLAKDGTASAFVAENKGLVARCYGWYGDSLAGTTPVDATVDGNCYSAYFVDLDPSVEDHEVNPDDLEKGKIVTLYTADGTKDIISAAALQGSVNRLANTAYKWYTGGHEAFPYADKQNKTYLYPMIDDHYGDWLTPPQYAFGIVYYETYEVKTEDGTKSVREMHMVDLSGGDTIEGRLNKPYVTVDGDSVTATAENVFDNEGTITSTGYAVFARKGNNVLESVCEDDKPEFTYKLSNNTMQAEVEYEFYAMNTSMAYNGEITIDSASISGGSATVNIFFADALNTENVFYVRTPAQLQKVPTVPSAAFHQTHDISVSELPALTQLSGSYNGHGVALSASAQSSTWITEVAGTVENLNLVLPANVKAPIFGTVSGTVDLCGLTVGNIEQGGALAETVSASGTMTIPAFNASSVSGKLFGDSTGTIKTGAITVGTTDTDGKRIPGAVAQLFGKVADATVSGDIQTGNVSGKLFGDVTGIVTTGKITVQGDAAQVFGTVTGEVTTNDIAVTGTATKIFGDVSGNGVTVNSSTDNGGISAKNAAQIFGTVGAAVDVNGQITVTENLTGNAIGAISADFDSDGITLGDVADQIAVISSVSNGEVNTGDVTVENVTGKIIGEITGGTVTLGAVRTETIGAATVEEGEEGEEPTVTITKTATLFGEVKGGSLTVASIDTDEKSVYGNIFSNVSGDVTTGTITTGAVSGQIFGNVAGSNVTTGAITVNGGVDKVFGAISANDGKTNKVTVASINTGDVTTQVFGTVGAPVIVGTVDANNVITVGPLSVGNAPAVFGDVSADVTTGTITAGAGSGNIFGDVAGSNVTTGAITVNGGVGQVFGAISTIEGKANKVTVASINTGDVTTQVFGTVGAPVVVGTVGADNAITGGPLSVGKAPAVFGDVSADVTTGTITAGAGSGQIFGNVAGSNVTTGAITVNGGVGQVFGAISTIEGKANKVTVASIDTGDVTTQVFGTVGAPVIVGTVDANNVITGGPLSVGNAPAVLGDVSANVTTGTITAGAVSGNIMGNIGTGATVTTGNVSVASLGGKLALNVSGTLQGTSGNGKATVSLGAQGSGLGTAVTLNNPLVGTVSGTLKNYTISVGTVRASVIPTLTDTGTVQNVSLSASTATLNAPVLVADNGGSITSCSVSIGTVNITGGEGNIGVLANKVSSGKTIDGNTIVAVDNLTITGATGNVGILVGQNNGTITGSTITKKSTEEGSTLTATLSGANIGGLVGDNYGELTNNNVTVDALNVTGKKDTLTVVGGVAAVNNNAAISGGSTTVHVNYTQVNGDQIGIGGLVGWMKGGSLTGTAGTPTVSGSINLNDGAKAEGRTDYFIGGAVAFDGDVPTVNNGVIAGSGTTYTSVSSAVSVDKDWAKANLVMQGLQFQNIGNGPVGMFVGVATDGTFTDCSSTTAGAYQFLGEVMMVKNTLSGSDWYSHQLSNAPGTVNGTLNVATPNYESYTKRENGYAYYTFDTVLDNCTFIYADGKEYEQNFAPTEYFYKGSEEKIEFYVVGNQVGRVNAVQATGKKINDLHPHPTTQISNETVTTSFYWYDGAGTYHRVYVQSKYNWNWGRTYTITFRYGDSKTKFHEEEKKIEDLDDPYSGPALYSLSVDFNSDSKLYMIADASGTKAMAIDQNGAARTVNKVSGNFKTTDDAFAAVWDISDGTGLRNAKYTNKYLNLNGSFTASSGNGVVVEGNSFIGTSFSAKNPKFTLRCNSGSYLTYSNNAFGMGSSGSALSIYEVSKSNDFQMKGTFVYQNIYNMMCGAYDENGNLLTIPASISEEPEIPAGNGGDTGSNT